MPSWKEWWKEKALQPETVVKTINLQIVRKVKILYLDHYAKIGGGQRSLLGHLKNMDKNRFYPIVVCPGRGKFYDELKRLDVDVRLVDLGREIIELDYTKNYGKAGNPFALLINSLTGLTGVVSLLKLIREESIDIIHANSFRASLIGAIISRISGVSSIHHMRIFPTHGYLDDLAMLLSTRTIANSKEVARALNKIERWDNKITVIYNGIDLRKFNPDTPNGASIRKEFHLKENEQIVGIVGRIAPEKDQKTFVETAARISRILADTKFLIVGDALIDKEMNYKNRIIRLVKNTGLKEHIIFTGFRDDIPQIMSSLDLLVVPSLHEPFGRVAIEAMAMEKPIIGTSVGGLLEIIDDGNTGLLIPLKCPNLLAEAIIALLKDEKRRKCMGEKGRQRVEQYFDIKVITKQVEALYEDILRGKQGE